MLDQEILKIKNLELMSEKPEQVLSKKARQTTHKVRTVEIGENDLIFFKVPACLSPNLQRLGATTYSLKLDQLT